MRISTPQIQTGGLSRTSTVTEMKVIPVAGRDSILLNLRGCTGLSLLVTSWV
jgi:hypothetical protein